MKAKDVAVVSAAAVLTLALSALIFIALLRYLPLVIAVVLTLIALSTIASILLGLLGALAKLAAGLCYALRPERREGHVRPIGLEEARELDRGEGED